MNVKRNKRINEEIKKLISELIVNGIKDPRISLITSISYVDITNDYSLAKIFVSVLGNDNEKKNTILGLESASGFIKKEIGKHIKLRIVPELKFILDDSIEHSMYMQKLIQQVTNESNERDN